MLVAEINLSHDEENTCNQITNHKLKANHYSQAEMLGLITGEPIDDEPFDPGVDEASYIEYRLWYCMGCDTGTLEILYMLPPHLPQSKLYPRRKRMGVSYKKYSKLPDNLEQIYREIILSFNNDLLILCAVGLRALIEGICSNKGITKGNLQKKLEGLKEYLPHNIVDKLHSFRYLGNEAIHELKPPNHFQLKMYIDVAEDLLNFLYELEYKTEQIDRMRIEQKVDEIFSDFFKELPPQN